MLAQGSGSPSAASQSNLAPWPGSDDRRAVTGPLRPEPYTPEAGFVRVACDFAADGLWTRRGSALTPEHLGLSPALSVALRAWQAHYEELFWQVERETPHFPFDAYDRVGRAIAALVASERPDLHVVYRGDEPYPGDYRCDACHRLNFPGEDACDCARGSGSRQSEPPPR